MNQGLYPNGNGRFTSREFPASQNDVTIEVLHGLGVLPRRHKWVLVCKKADLGYAPGDEMDVMSARDNASDGIHFNVSANGAICRLVLFNANNIEVFRLSDRSQQTITIGSWAFKCYAEA